MTRLLTERAAQAFFNFLNAAKAFDIVDFRTERQMATRFAYAAPFPSDGEEDELVEFLATTAAVRFETEWARLFMSRDAWMNLGAGKPRVVSRGWKDEDAFIDWGQKTRVSDVPEILVCDVLMKDDEGNLVFGPDGVLSLAQGAGQLRTWSPDDTYDRGVRIVRQGDRLEIQVAMSFHWDPALGDFFQGTASS